MKELSDLYFKDFQTVAEGTQDLICAVNEINTAVRELQAHLKALDWNKLPVKGIDGKAEARYTVAELWKKLDEYGSYAVKQREGKPTGFLEWLEQEEK